MLGQNVVGAELDEEAMAQFAAKAAQEGQTVSERLRVLIRRDSGLADENRAAVLRGQKMAKKLA